ncbi:MAG: hypothetical protein Q9170_004569 [Blastenia crenularia]
MTSEAPLNSTQSTPAQYSLPQRVIQSNDFWQKALANLDSDLRASLDCETSTKRGILEKTREAAEEKRQISMKRRWKYDINGREVVLRDIFENIIRWLDHFKAIGDVGVQYDQAHAALPWAGVRFLLKVAVSDTNIFASTVLGLETISHLITRYAIWEHVHKHRNTVASAELEPLLTSVYTEILIFLARAKKYFQTPTGVWMLKSTLVTFQNDQLQKIAAQDAKVSAMAVLSDAETLNFIRDLGRPVHRIASQAAQYAESLEDTRYRKILDWLSPINFIHQQNRHSEQRLQGSGEWLLNHPKFLDWQSSSSSSIFLLHGMAGSGKTSLVSAVVDSILCQSSNQAAPSLLAYFYCSKATSEVGSSHPKEIMRSIVRQLSITGVTRKSIHRAVVNDYNQRETKAKSEGFDTARLSLRDCIGLVLNITGSDHAIIIIDALDEVRPQSRYDLVESLQQICKESASVVEIFVTSRDDDQISFLLTDVPALRIEPQHNRADMESFIHHQVALATDSRRLLGGDVPRQLQSDLTQALIDSAGEVFQLVICQIEKLCDMRHHHDVKEAMSRFSEDTLDRLYAGVLNGMCKAEGYSSQTAIRAFSLLLCSHEPLSPASFLTALTMTDGTCEMTLQLPELLRICHSFIIIDSKSNVLRFAHTSIQDFLEAQPAFVRDKVENTMAEVCLMSCLHSPIVATTAELCPSEHFDQYAVLYWADHCSAAFASGTQPRLIQLAQEFMVDNGTISLVFHGWLEDAREHAKILPRYHSSNKKLSAVCSRHPTLLFTLCI